jgi:hypothetical protein
MLTLKDAFPNACFIHIVRDPRDRALSVSNAWNGDLLLAAERWRQQVANAQFAMKAFPDDYLEVRYEDLLDNPRAVLETVCAFLQLPSDDSVTQLGAPVENQGAQDSPTRTSAEIVNQNTKKYLGAFDDVVLRRMEEIALPMMLEKGYLPQANAIEHKPLGKREAFLRSRKDDISSVLYHLHRFGLKNGMLFSIERFRIGRI